MKVRLVAILVSVLSLFAGSSLLAEAGAAGTTPAPVPTNVTAPPSGVAMPNRPCRALEQACQGAGYFRGGHRKGQNKGLFLDCMKPLLAGGSVAGVTVSADEVQACQQRRARHGK